MKFYKLIKNSKKILKLFRIIKNISYLKTLIRCGVAPVDEHCKILSLLNCSFVVDIGANRGQFALVVRNCFPHARIVSFEPLEVPANKYSCVFKDDDKVRLCKVAIGEENSTKTIHVSKSDDSSSLLPITATQSELFPGTEEERTETIEVNVLEDHITADEVVSPSLLKIDVQGYELEVLNGSLGILNYFDYIYVECSFVELYEGQAFASSIIAFLQNKSFALCGVYNMSYDQSGRAIQADFLFKK